MNNNSIIKLILYYNEVNYICKEKNYYNIEVIFFVLLLVFYFTQNLDILVTNKLFLYFKLILFIYQLNHL